MKDKYPFNWLHSIPIEERNKSAILYENNKAEITSVSYTELIEKVNALSGWLTSKFSPMNIIGVRFERGPEYVV